MKLHEGARYEINGINGTLDGQPAEFANMALAFRDNDAATVEPDETPSDTKAFIQVVGAVGETDQLMASATSLDGTRKFVAIPADVEVIPVDVPLPDGNFELDFREVFAA